MTNGITYFPMDCHYDDEKLPMIEAEYGITGFAVVVKLFQKIYGGMGYYCEWNDRTALLFAKNNGIDCKLVTKVVNAAAEEGIFSADMLRLYGVLTYHGIQKRYRTIVKRRRVIFDRPELVLVEEEDCSKNADNSGENVCNTNENVCNSATSKVKESKANESKVNESEAKQSEAKESIPPAAACGAATKELLCEKYGIAAVADYEQRFCKWQSRQGRVKADMYPTIARWLEQDGVTKPSYDTLNDQIMQELIEQYSTPEVTDALYGEPAGGMSGAVSGTG